MRTIFNLVMGIALLGAVLAQAAEPPASQPARQLPRKLGVVYLSRNEQLIDLERQIAKITTKGSAGAIFSSLATGGVYQSKIKVVIILKGAAAPVRTRENRPVFLVRVMPGFDPRNFQLIPFVAKEKERYSVTAEAGGWLGIQVEAEQGFPTLPLDAEPTPEDPYVIMLTPVNDLVPGEYAISATTSTEGFCFGVDKNAEVQ